MSRRTWTDTEDEVLLAGLGIGKTHAEIARRLCRPVTSIGSRIDTLTRHDPDRLARARAGALILNPATATAPQPHSQPNDTGKRKPRSCLRCRRVFDSAHAGNRLCQSCRAAASSAYSPYAP